MRKNISSARRVSLLLCICIVIAVAVIPVAVYAVGSDGASISGVVTGGTLPDTAQALEGVTVTVIPVTSAGIDDTSRNSKNGVTTGEGIYSITDLAPGPYKILFKAAGNTYRNEFFSGTTSSASATLISVAAGEQAGGINAMLRPKGDIPVPQLGLSASAINLQNQASFVVTGTVEPAAGAAGYNAEIVFMDTDGLQVTRTVAIGSSGAFSTTADVSGLKDGTVSIKAALVDDASNRGGTSASINITKDTVAPPAPTLNAPNYIGPGNMAGYTVSGSVGSSAVVGTSVTVRASDGTREVTATVNPNTSGAFSAQLNLSAFSNGNVTVTARATDAAGNGGATTTIQAKKDTTAPSVPSSISIKALSNGKFLVGWTTSTDAISGISHYEVIINSGTPTAVNSTSYSFQPTNNTTYSIVVRAHDKAGNTATSSAIIARLQTGSSITIPTGSNVTVALRTASGSSPISVSFPSVSESNKTVSVTAGSSNSVGTPSGYSIMGSYYDISLSSGSWYSGTVTVVLPYSDTNMTPEQERVLRLYHYKNGWRNATSSVDTTNNLITGTTGNFSVFAVFIDNTNAAKIKDTVAPAPPKNLTVTSNKGFIQLNWTANTESDFSHYNIYRRLKSSTTYAKLNLSALTSTQYQDKAAVLGTTYAYYVTAVDKAGNESLKSNIVETTVEAVKLAIAFVDVPANAWYKAAVSKLTTKDIISGYVNGTFGPNLSVTRAEFAKMMCLAMGWKVETPAQRSFTDVGSSHWALAYIETAKKNGAIDGYPGGTFRPSGNITRAEIAKMMSQALKLPSGTSSLRDIGSSWAKDYIAACVKAGIVKGYPDNTFKPDNNATRAEAAVIIASQVKD